MLSYRKLLQNCWTWFYRVTKNGIKTINSSNIRSPWACRRADSVVLQEPERDHGFIGPMIYPLLIISTLLYPVLAQALYFPAPVVTDRSSDFIGSIHINGRPAQPGDEVAFFCPNDDNSDGVVCGLYVVTEPGEYGIVAVYGDDPTTVDDEGAQEGDTLTVRIWYGKAGVELAGEAIILSGGEQIGSFVPSPTPPVWRERAGYVLNIEAKTHFSDPAPTPLVSNYIGDLTIEGEPAEAGDEIAVFDSSSFLVGHFIITVPGKYGIMQVYGDDSTTPFLDEGAHSGEKLIFKVWDRSVGLEYSGNKLTLFPGSPIGSFLASSQPPVWTEATGYVLDIQATQVSTIKGDINNDRDVNLQDAILASQVSIGLSPAGIRPDYRTSGVDVGGDGKIGLAEAIYVLQVMAGLRPRPPDVIPPSVPTALTATAASLSLIDLSWTSSSDNVEVSGYRIYKDGVYLKSVSGLSATDTGLSGNTSYCYTVSAYDAAGNESDQSPQACATTQYTEEGVQISALSASSAMPGALLTIGGSGFDPGGELTVRFSDDQGYAVDVPAIDADTESVTVAVPPFIDMITGEFNQGSVNVQVVLKSETPTFISNSISNFQLQELPVPLTPPGSITLSFLKASLTVAQSLQSDAEYLSFTTPILNTALANQISSLENLVAKIETTVHDPSQTYVIGLLNGAPITIKQSDLQAVDRLLLGMLLAIGKDASASPLALKSPSAALSEDVQDESGCMQREANNYAQAVMENPDAQLISGAYEVVYAPRQAYPCKVAYSFNTAFKVVGASAAMAMGSLASAGAGFASLAHSMAAMLSVTLEIAGGMIAVGGVLGQTTPGAKDLVQGGIDKIEEFKYVPVKAAISYLSPVTGDLIITGLGTQSLYKALTSAPPHGTGAVYTLSVSKAGTGTGVIGITPVGPNYASGTRVTVTAKPDDSSVFDGWSEGCSGTGACEVTMNSNIAVVAQFTRCTYSISPNGASFEVSGGGGGVTVTTPSDCAWTAASNSSWISITSVSTGKGNGTVGYAVAANTGAQSRTGAITIAGQAFAVVQAGSFTLAGSLSGGWAGTCVYMGYSSNVSGGFSIGISKNGGVSGSYSGSDSGSISGSVSSNGNYSAGSAGGVAWSGTISRSGNTLSGSGGWSGTVEDFACSGGWSGSGTASP